MSERELPLARDLSGVKTSYTWNYGDAKPGADGSASTREGAQGDAGELHAQVSWFRDALEDVVALALSGADYKERAIMMHRRAVAALSGVPVQRPRGAPDRGAG